MFVSNLDTQSDTLERFSFGIFWFVLQEMELGLSTFDLRHNVACGCYFLGRRQCLLETFFGLRMLLYFHLIVGQEFLQQSHIP